MKNSKLQQEIETLKTVNSFMTDSISYNDEKMAEIIKGVNILFKAKLQYCSTKDEEFQNTLYTAVLSDKVKLIQLISNL